MPYAVNVRSDNESANLIRELWRDASNLEQDPSMESLNYPPHLTLAIYDEIDSSLVIEAVQEVFANFESCSVRFERLGMFETPHFLVLWAAPMIPPEIKQAHDKIHTIIDPFLSRPNYRPGVWVPHCSLATAIPLTRKAEALEFTDRFIESLDVVFDVSDCASFLPVEVLHEVVLAPTT